MLSCLLLEPVLVETEVNLNELEYNQEEQRLLDSHVPEWQMTHITSFGTTCTPPGFAFPIQDDNASDEM